MTASRTSRRRPHLIASLALLPIAHASFAAFSQPAPSTFSQSGRRRAVHGAVLSYPGATRDEAPTRDLAPTSTASEPFAEYLAARELDELLGDDAASMRASMSALGLQASRPTSLPQRGVFCTRELDMRDVEVIGYDMDYTLIDYKMELCEELVYDYSKDYLSSIGFPVSGLHFNPELVVRGIIIDRERGNLLKVDRFGYVRRAMHGTRRISPDEILKEYGDKHYIDLRDPRWVFLNTLFSVSEGCLYAQLVDRLDSGVLLAEAKQPFDATLCSTYEALYAAVGKALFQAHVQSTMKADIMKDPLKFVNVDPAYTRTLLDQRAAGKKLVLITNSDWLYTNTMMKACFSPYLPEGTHWRDLFSIVIVSACKPDFFIKSSKRPVYEIATTDGMMREAYSLKVGRLYAGGNAQLVEKCLNASGPRMMYVGDHLFTDVNLAKRSGWRTCFILQELEYEMEGMQQGESLSHELTRLLKRKDLQAAYLNHARTRLYEEEPQLAKAAPLVDSNPPSSAAMVREARDAAEARANAAAAAGASARAVHVSPVNRVHDRQRVEAAIESLERQVEESDRLIAELLHTEGNHVNQYWGYLSRAGFADKSHLMRQIEKYADIYTSRVSNLLPYTPHKQFLCMRQSLPHSTRACSIGFLEDHWVVENDGGDVQGREQRPSSVKW